tara:strand:+ start:30 stop:761 length:732 start_codon:yes stop_codon:yes gene_type:complete
MIELNNITKSFSEKIVLEDVSIKIDDGECIAIIGKSGIGKSVLLKHIIGLMRPDSGEVKIDGYMINSLSFRKLQEIRSSIGMVFQFGALFDSMNVYKNISLALEKFSELSSNAISEKVSEVLDSVGMAGSELLMPSELSGGMKKRVGIARAIALSPKYLLYDEPTTGLDPIMTGSINKLIKKIHKSGNITSIMVTHELKTVYEVASRVVMIDEKKVVFDNKPSKLIDSDRHIVKQFIADNENL